jgi:organic hydroperoxide reductase OsmC/OhrA
MRISAEIHNQEGKHEVRLTTNDQSHSITIPPKSTGFGSSTNGGELLFLALATCYCNDIYREAEKRNIKVRSVEVTVEGEFGQPGESARNLTYRARVTAEANEEVIRSLMKQTDQIAEIQNTLRTTTPITLTQIEAVSLDHV